MSTSLLKALLPEFSFVQQTCCGFQLFGLISSDFARGFNVSHRCTMMPPLRNGLRHAMIISLSEPEAKCSKSPNRPTTGLEAVVRRDHGCLRGVNLSRMICNEENPLKILLINPILRLVSGSVLFLGIGRRGRGVLW
ncbi:hypothetical protein J7T55_000890 [Diaporthe amygdali]|uniref:uncharacterized protein n=1 Tax=Phomopsis amygdali TaxID=1214568 RepID=UPI0022FE3EED|nr:uncharacterized protein J7T55_000890 [Diaporthe amygdali]KAJ0120037.1 hypothetical protein J7T55_000890 [Diaporthe amygdali]